MHGKLAYLATASTAAILIAGCDGRPATGLSPGGGNGGGGAGASVDVTKQGIIDAARANLTTAFVATVVAGRVAADTEPLGAFGLGGSSRGTEAPEAVAARDADRWIDRFFNPADVVTEEAKLVVFRTDKSRACSGNIAVPVPGMGGVGNGGGGDGGGEEPEPAPVVENDCTRAVERAPLWLAVRSPRDGDLDLQVLIGPEKRRLGTVKLYRDRLEVDVNLGQIGNAFEVAARILGISDVPAPDRMQGAVGLEIVRKREHVYDLALAVTQAIAISRGGTDRPYSFELAAKSPAISAEIDGNAQRLEIAADLGSVDASGPLEVLDALQIVNLPCDGENQSDDPPGGNGGGGGTGNGGGTGTGCEGAGEGTVVLQVAGLTARGELDANTDRAEITDLGLGGETARLSVDGSPVIELDVNASAGRKLAFTATKHTDGAETHVRPSLEIAARYRFAAIADKIGDVAEWLLNEDLGVTLDGATEPGFVLFDRSDAPTVPGGNGGAEPGGGGGGGGGVEPPPPDPADESPLLRIVAGVLTISAKGIAAPITVPSGSCLFGAFEILSGSDSAPAPIGTGGGGMGGTATGDHPFGSLRNAACP